MQCVHLCLCVNGTQHTAEKYMLTKRPNPTVTVRNCKMLHSTFILYALWTTAFHQRMNECTKYTESRIHCNTLCSRIFSLLVFSSSWRSFYSIFLYIVLCRLCIVILSAIPFLFFETLLRSCSSIEFKFSFKNLFSCKTGIGFLQTSTAILG